MKKIVLIGRAGVGKTTMKRVIFDGNDPLSLILHPLAPTRGVHSYNYRWIDLNLNLFDTSGQELPFILEDEIEQTIIFDKAEAIIYVIDYPLWVFNSQEIIDELNKIHNLLGKIQFKSPIFLFLHKIDLINQKFKEKNQAVNDNLNLFSQIPEEFPIFFTSLHPKLIYSTYNAFNEVLSDLSTEASNLKKILDKKLQNYSSSMCLIINQGNSVIVQSSTRDFDINLIFNIHKKLYQVLKYSPDLFKRYKKVVPIDFGPRVFGVVFESLEGFNNNLKDLICICETEQKDRLEELTSEIVSELHRYYN